MRKLALGKHGWSAVSGLLLTTALTAPAHAAPNAPFQPNPQFAIGSPTPNSLVGGRITVSVAYNQGLSKITAFTVYVDDAILYSQKAGETLPVNGIQYLPLDTTTLTDGNHTIKVVATGMRGRLGEDALSLTVKNGLAGGQDIVPPLVQFRNLLNGQEVSGTIDLDVLAEDNAMQNLFVSIFVNQEVKLLKNVPPYSLRLDTAKYLDPKTGKGEIRVEAWAYDKANNLGKAKPIILSVVPTPTLDATKKQDDPTSKPVMPDGSLREPLTMLPLKQGGTKLDVDLVAKAATMAEMKMTMPSPLPTGGAGEAISVPGISQPGDRIPNARAARNGGSLVEPDSVTGGSEVRGTGSLTGPKVKLPSDVRVMMAKADPRKEALSPQFLPSLGGSPVLGGARTSTPATSAKPTVQASANGVRVDLPLSPKAVQPGITARKPTLEARLNGAAVPGSNGAEKPGEGVIVVVPAGAKPDQNGKVPVQVYRPKTMALSEAPLPRDRDYRVQRGDSLTTIAKRFNVTPKAIQIANGITGGMPVGSIIKVPGTFDVVMNNQRLAFDVSPRIQGGLPLAPFRQIFEHAGGVVVYFPDTKEVRAANDSKDIKLKIGSKEATVNQVLVVMEKEAAVDSGRTIVPVSFLEKALDLKAEYDVKTGTVILGQK